MQSFSQWAAAIRGSSLVLGFGLLAILSFPGVPKEGQAYDFSWRELDVSFDTTITVGVAVRTKNPQEANYCTTIGDTNVLDGGVVPDGAGNGPGANGDCGKSAGNLNYFKGDATATPIRGLHELDAVWRNYSAFVRFQWWFDGINQYGDRARTELTDQAKDRVALGIDLLDAFLQGSWYPKNVPVSLRFGNQVVNWGESTFLQNGINTINPIDVSRIRNPGAELREALRAVPILWGSVAPTENLSFEGFYQFWWQETWIDPPGTFFSTHDALGRGGKWFDISQGHHDCDISPFAGLAPGGGSVDGLQVGLRQDGTVGATCIRRGGDVDPNNQGQYGFAARLFVPQLNATEFGLFFTNLHSRLPYVSGAYQETVAQAAFRLFGGPPANQAQALAATNAVLSGTRAVQEYPENIKKLGFSLSTTIDRFNIALQGEFAYNFNHPLQLSEIALLRGLFDGAGIPGTPPPIGVTPPGPGEFFSGGIEKDLITAQMTATYVGEPGRIVGGILKADQLVLVSEIGVMHITDFDDPSDLPLQASVTPQAIATGNSADQFTSFATSNSMGYVIRSGLRYNNLFWGVNVIPSLGFRHDFYGFSPAPVGNYVEHRMALSPAIRFEFQNSWSSTIRYTDFFNGGIDDPRTDRDFFAWDLKYSF